MFQSHRRSHPARRSTPSCKAAWEWRRRCGESTSAGNKSKKFKHGKTFSGKSLNGKQSGKRFEVKKWLMERERMVDNRKTILHNCKSLWWSTNGKILAGLTQRPSRQIFFWFEMKNFVYAIWADADVQLTLSDVARKSLGSVGMKWSRPCSMSPKNKNLLRVFSSGI